MSVYPKAQTLELLLICLRARLTREMSQYHAAHVQAVAPERVDESQNVHVVGDAEISSHLRLFYVAGVDDDNYLRVILHLREHPDLTVRLKARQYSRRMEIVEELSSELQIKLAAEASYSFQNVLRLHLQVFVIVKTDSAHVRMPSFSLSV